MKTLKLTDRQLEVLLATIRSLVAQSDNEDGSDLILEAILQKLENL